MLKREANPAVWPAMIASASLVAQLIAGKATRDALFLTHFGLKLLPPAMIGAAVLSALSVLVMSRTLTAAGPARVVPASFAASAILFLCEWALSLKSERATAIAVYAHTAMFSQAIGSAFWSLVNERFDPHEAKRLVGRIASGGTVGGVIGGLLVWGASARLSVPMMLALLATMSVVGLWGSLRLGPSVEQRAMKSPAIVAVSGFKAFSETPYLRDLALLVGAGAVVQALLDWLLNAHATYWWQGQALLGFFALFNMIVGVLSFLAQTLLTRVILEKRGLGGTIKLQPMSLAAGAVVALIAPVFATVIVARVIEAVTRSSLYRSAYELFYTPLPNAKKRPTKTIIDVGVDRVGTAIGSIGLFAVAHIGAQLAARDQLELQTRIVLFGVLAMTAASIYIAARLQDGYVSALASSLKSGAVALEDDDAEDLTTRKTLAETTALLNRDKLLARIEQFQRQKEPRDRSKESGAKSDEAGGPRLVTQAPISERAPNSMAAAKDLALFVDPNDALVAKIAALRSTEAAAIKRALTGSLSPGLAPFVIPLLANDAVVRDAVRSLRKAAPKITGMLLDHLLDVDVDPRVRRRIPRILKVCRTQRAASGLLLALRDPVFEVRVQVAIALAQLVEENVTASAFLAGSPVPPARPGVARIRLEVEEVMEVVRHELSAGRASWSISRTGASLDADPPDEDGTGRASGAGTPVASANGRSTAPPTSDPLERVADEPRKGGLSYGRPAEGRATQLNGEGAPLSAADELRRGLGHVFVVLGLVLEREPLSIAYRALRAEDPSLRGTAFEYLEVVLPADIRDIIMPLLDLRDVKAPPRSRERDHKELADALLRSRS